ncbi:hypothetical protein V5P93_003475 [Actinokineospora auranticolor]|uniref:Uncharacterized protein n=1 Tax=Actinokineospora auranticolor TaxID=155976 RepID=A0A2S6GPI3_9PSEU|nr:hypothetical protein [Actinokineospora auranticolor]PPK67138.1 hypothetical protein CLV40_108135 [Actinokineospora auranticolor]
MHDFPPPQHRPAVPVTAQELRTAAASDHGKRPLVLVPAVIGNAQAAHTAMNGHNKTTPSPTASAVAAAQDRVGNAAIAGAMMRTVPVAVPSSESHPGH